MIPDYYSHIQNLSQNRDSLSTILDYNDYQRLDQILTLFEMDEVEFDETQHFLGLLGIRHYVSKIDPLVHTEFQGIQVDLTNYLRDRETTSIPYSTETDFEVVIRKTIVEKPYKRDQIMATVLGVDSALTYSWGETALSTGSSSEDEAEATRSDDENADFVAYPLVETDSDYFDKNDPDFVVALDVGFRASPSETQFQDDEIIISDPPDGALVTVHVTCSDAFIKDPVNKLELNYDDPITFFCTPKADAGDILTFKVNYYYLDKRIGRAELILPSKSSYSQKTRTKAQHSACRVQWNQESGAIIWATLERNKSTGELVWFIQSPLADHHPLIQGKPQTYTVEFFKGDLDKLAISIATTIGNLESPDDLQYNLATLGREIHDYIPSKFFDIIHAVYKDVLDEQQIPHVIIDCDDTLIPWELAFLLDCQKIDPQKSNYLGGQVILSRWVNHHKILSPPRTAVKVRRASVVRDEYGATSGGTGVELKYALKEGDDLHKLFKDNFRIPEVAEPLTAVRKDILDMIRAPRQDTDVTGHLIHMALHAEITELADSVSLTLRDKEKITPGDFFRKHECHDDPTIEFIFINACQAGAGDTSFGQAYGFPNEMLQGGVQGFIAPLWKIDDNDVTYKFAMKFYETLLGQDKSVAEFLYDMRSDEDHPLWRSAIAYIFFGNPYLRLQV